MAIDILEHPQDYQWASSQEIGSASRVHRFIWQQTSHSKTSRCALDHFPVEKSTAIAFFRMHMEVLCSPMQFL